MGNFLKHQLVLPAFALIVALGGYFGVSSFFFDIENDALEAESRSKSREIISKRDQSRLTDMSLSEANFSKTINQNAADLSENSAQKETGGVASDKSHTQRKLAGNQNPAIPPRRPTKSSIKNFLQDDNKLREQIMNEAYLTALHSAKPWENLIIISSEYYRRGELTNAREILLDAAKLATDPDDIMASSGATRDVVKAMLAQKQHKDAMNSLQNIHSATDREKAMAEVAVWAVRDGQVTLAKKIVGQIGSEKIRDTPLVSIAESQAGYEGIKVACETAESVSSENKKNDAYRRIATKRAQRKDFVDAELAISYITSDKVKDSALSSVARIQARSGDINGGLRILNDISNPSVSNASLRVLSTELAKYGWFASSSYVTTRIDDEREKSFALERLSTELAKAGDVSLSLVKTDDIPLDNVRNRALRNVSSVTANRETPQQARNVAVRIDSDTERDRAFRDIAKVAASRGNHVAAFNTLQEIDIPKDKALAMVSLARAYQKKGRSRKALQILGDAGRMAKALSSTKEMDTVRADMAVAYAESQQSERSLHLADSIDDSNRRDRAYQNLAHTLALKKDVQAAQRSILAISSDQLRRSAEDKVAKALAKGIAPQRAVRSSRSLLTGRQRVVFLMEISKRT